LGFIMDLVPRVDLGFIMDLVPVIDLLWALLMSAKLAPPLTKKFIFNPGLVTNRCCNVNLIRWNSWKFYTRICICWNADYKYDLHLC
jgi:hypothetical protein